MPKTIISAGTKMLDGLRTKYIGDPYIAEAAVLVPSQFRNSPGTPSWFFGPNGIDYKFIFEGATSATKAFNMCPPLAAIISRKVQAYINGKTLLLNTKGKDAAGDMAGRIRRLLRSPNPFQSWQDFEAQLQLYVYLFGWCPVMPLYPAGFEKLKIPGTELPDRSEASSLWLIPPYMLSYKERQTSLWYAQSGKAKPSDIVEHLILHYKSEKVEMNIDELFIFKDYLPSFDSQYFPGSRIRPLAMPINNIISTYESRNELINYAGAQGVLTPTNSDVIGSIPLQESEKEQLQADFKRQYGIKRGQSRYIISPSPVDWKQMGRATKDLMLFEEIVDDVMRICDSYNYPSPLLNSEKGPSVSNTETYKKDVYENGTIPESLAMYDQWNKFFGLDEMPMALSKSYDHLPILQQDQVLQGQARLALNQACEIEWENNLITLNQWRLEQGIDATEDGDIYYWQTQGKASILDQAPLPPQNQPKYEPTAAATTEQQT
jgi:Phage portal protein